ncbi:hypothetical protein [Sphingomonas sp. R1]|uniref:hypothetical protein n=1 Tax=Sphingomonas sp. R1 TaxID=399176 RepID=UPI0022251047|nr:hypothetical protein [Sphingomonas sp. R1]UYY76428.1 hypothetical protein OIM94_12970 [Sphingomonas sp. R1]
METAATERKVVLCAGLNRSGSTWQMNVTRELLQQYRPQCTVYTSWFESYDANNDADIHIVKVHRFRDAGGIDANVILSTHRDLRAVAGSMVRMRWVPAEWKPIDAFLEQYVEDCSAWSQRADLVLPYEVIVACPIKAAMDIARAIGLEPSEEAAAMAVQRVSAMRPIADSVTGDIASADPHTFLHGGHIGDVEDTSSMARLPSELIARIELRYRSWLSQRGYNLSVERLVSLAEYSFKDGYMVRQILTSAPLKFSKNAGEDLILFGLDAEEWGAWSVGPLCGITFHVPASSTMTSVVLRIGALTPEGASPVCATGFLNGSVAGSWTWVGSVDHQDIKIPLSSTGNHVLCFLVHGTRSPRALRLGADEREIGLAFHEIWLED